MLPGVSIASVALANQLNANYLRRWLKDYKEQQSSTSEMTSTPSKALQAFVPVKVAHSNHLVNSQKAAQRIHPRTKHTFQYNVKMMHMRSKVLASI